MKIVECIGILVLACRGCESQFVVNTEAVKQGFQWHCQCGRFGYFGCASKLEVSISGGIDYNHACKAGQKRFDGHLRRASAMPLEEYKALLAEKILGKKPRVPTKSKNAVSFEDSGVNIAVIANALQGLGFKDKEIMAKIDVAVRDGFFQEDEIIRHILSFK